MKANVVAACVLACVVIDRWPSYQLVLWGDNQVLAVAGVLGALPLPLGAQPCTPQPGQLKPDHTKRLPCGKWRRAINGVCWIEFSLHGSEEENIKRICASDEAFEPNPGDCLKKKLIWRPAYPEAPPTAKR
jgi:hypothetical protein